MAASFQLVAELLHLVTDDLRYEGSAVDDNPTREFLASTNPRGKAQAAID
jgi:hypothetical protein